jgi:hypothetical protein
LNKLIKIKTIYFENNKDRQLEVADIFGYDMKNERSLIRKR